MRLGASLGRTVSKGGVLRNSRVVTLRATRLSSTSQRQWSTPLAKTIADAINVTGPISIAAYMRQCLTSPEGGYYTTRSEGRDQFGQKGDFVTSPEISQTFGELIGLWFVAEWMSQGRKSSGVEIIEVGPGRGTLMDDMLRAIRNFTSMTSSIESIYLVEASPSLRDQQKELLCGGNQVQEVDIGFRSQSKHNNIPITWCEDIRFVPSGPDKSPFIVAHEFFDALPIHAFQSVAAAKNDQPTTIQGLSGPIEIKNQNTSQESRIPQWRELVVAPAPEPSVLSEPKKQAEPKPDFQLSMAKAATPSSLVFPETSKRYRALKDQPGSVIEISPESQAYAAEFARRIGGALPSAGRTQPGNSVETTFIPKPKPSGAALILDYGPLNTIPTSTLRGIQAHKLVSPFISPGRVDVSADVDFTALAEAAIDASAGVEVHGPVEQGFFLESMGIRERVKMLCRKLGADEEAKGRINTGAERLVERGGGGMGKLYKAMAIIPEGQGKRRPLGFGGGLGT